METMLPMEYIVLGFLALIPIGAYFLFVKEYPVKDKTQRKH